MDRSLHIYHRRPSRRRRRRNNLRLLLPIPGSSLDNSHYCLFWACSSPSVDPANQLERSHCGKLLPTVCCQRCLGRHARSTERVRSSPIPWCVSWYGLSNWEHAVSAGSDDSDRRCIGMDSRGQTELWTGHDYYTLHCVWGCGCNHCMWAREAGQSLRIGEAGWSRGEHRERDGGDGNGGERGRCW